MTFFSKPVGDFASAFAAAAVDATAAVAVAATAGLALLSLDSDPSLEELAAAFVGARAVASGDSSGPSRGAGGRVIYCKSRSTVLRTMDVSNSSQAPQYVSVPLFVSS